MTESIAERVELSDFPWHRGCPMAPPQEYAEIRATEPIRKVRLATGRIAWVVTRYEDVKKLLTDPRASSDRAHEGFPYYIDVPQQFRTEGSFIGWDPPKHTLHRRMAAVSGEFTRQRVRAMRPRMQEIVDECVDKMLETGPPVDLVHMLALRVPMTIVCEILGIPSKDQDYLHSCTDILFGGRSTAEERSEAITRVGKYLQDLVTHKEEHPGEDLISRMIARYRENGEYDRREMCNVTRLLLNGGHETSAAMIALGTMSLLEHPDQLEAFRNDPSLRPKAIEELLRYLSPGDLATSRVATADIEIGDVIVREGEGMILLGMSANHDPEVFERPGELDLSRGDRTHLAFGHGVHHCIGAEIARVELEIVLNTLLERIPGLAMDKKWQDLTYKDGNVMYGVYEMPVTW